MPIQTRQRQSLNASYNACTFSLWFHRFPSKEHAEHASTPNQRQNMHTQIVLAWGSCEKFSVGITSRNYLRKRCLLLQRSSKIGSTIPQNSSPGPSSRTPLRLHLHCTLKLHKTFNQRTFSGYPQRKKTIRESPNQGWGRDSFFSKDTSAAKCPLQGDWFRSFSH